MGNNETKHHGVMFKQVYQDETRADKYDKNLKYISYPDLKDIPSLYSSDLAIKDNNHMTDKCHNDSSRSRRGYKYSAPSDPPDYWISKNSNFPNIPLAHTKTNEPTPARYHGYMMNYKSSSSSSEVFSESISPTIIETKVIIQENRERGFKYQPISPGACYSFSPSCGNNSTSIYKNSRSNGIFAKHKYH